MKLYTKTGDKGKTGLIGGTRVEKSDIRLEAYGTIDELNANVGLLIQHIDNKEDILFLKNMQNLLFTVGSNLATDTTKLDYKTASVMKEEYITNIENEIDRLDKDLPALTNFILPGGNIASAQAHICRTISRRAERRINEMNNVFAVDENVMKYVNRLSDYFFILSRNILYHNNLEEILWKLPK